MSKRFGRNQKRHMREQLAQSIKTADCAKNLARAWENAEQAAHDKLIQERRKQQDFMAEISRIVGDAAVIVGEPEFSQYAYRDYDRALPRISLDSFSFQESLVPQFDAIRAETLRVLECKPLRDHLSRQMQFHFELAGKKVEYAISEHALATLPRSHIEDRLAKEIARNLMDVIFCATKGEKK